MTKHKNHEAELAISEFRENFSLSYTNVRQ